MLAALRYSNGNPPFLVLFALLCYGIGKDCFVFDFSIHIVVWGIVRAFVKAYRAYPDDSSRLQVLNPVDLAIEVNIAN